MSDKYVTPRLVISMVETDPTELATCFDLMEGRGFYNSSATVDPSGNSVQSIRHLYNYWMEKIKDKPFDPEWSCIHDSIGEIYGNGGFHRYYVTRDGGIHFSKFHASSWRRSKEEVAADAASLGFGVWN